MIAACEEVNVILRTVPHADKITDSVSHYFIGWQCQTTMLTRVSGNPTLSAVKACIFFQYHRNGMWCNRQYSSDCALFTDIGSWCCLSANIVSCQNDNRHCWLTMCQASGTALTSKTPQQQRITRITIIANITLLTGHLTGQNPKLLHKSQRFSTVVTVVRLFPISLSATSLRDDKSTAWLTACSCCCRLVSSSCLRLCSASNILFSLNTQQ